MKKYFVIMLVMTVCVGLLANESALPNFELSPTAIINNSNAHNRDMWDILFTFETTIPSMIGIETDGVNIYTASNNTEIFTRYDMNGVILDDFSIPGVSNMGDMAYDGTYFYGSPTSTTIQIMDLANETLIGTIPASCNGITNINHIAFDPELDGGTGGFWIGNLSGFGAIAMDGSEIHSNLTHPGFVWGSAYDPWTEGGPYIWLFSYEGGNDATLLQFEIASLSLTGVTHVASDIPGASTPAIAGGLATYVNDDDLFVMLANLQQSPHLVGVYEIAEVTSPGYIEGTVTLDGGTGDVQSIVVTAGGEESNPDVDGNYSIEIQPGTYDVTATLEDYNSDTVIGVVVEEGVTIANVDLTLVYNPQTFDPPENLAVDEETGLFTWDAPVSRDLTGYDIYLDSVFLENVTDTEFQFEDLVNEQTYLAGISAVYDDGTSEIIEIEFTFTPILNPPTNLEVIEFTGMFTWDAPVLGEPTGYDVYLDDELISSVGNYIFDYTFGYLVNGEDYVAGVSAVYDNGTSEIIEIDFTYTGTGAENDIASSTNLLGNYPNPFNPTTTISYSLLQQEMVTISIYNVKGGKIRTIVNEITPAGNHQVFWNGNDDNNEPVSSGMYLYRLRCGRYSSTRKMILLK